MPDRMSEDMPDKTSEYMSENICQVECQKIRRTACQNIRQVGRMSKNMPDRMSEYCIYIYIYVKYARKNVRFVRSKDSLQRNVCPTETQSLCQNACQALRCHGGDFRSKAIEVSFLIMWLILEGKYSQCSEL